MGVHDAPQWLLSAFYRSARRAGASAPDDEVREVGQALVDQWSGPGREFHNLKHLVDVLVRVDELAEETHETDLVRLAAWYHGVVFDSADGKAYANKGGEDEAASAVLAREQLTSLGVPDAAAERVHDLVVALVRHTPDPTDFDCAVLCDADLAMLAAEPQRYKAYLHDVRAEYAHLPVEDYVRARIRILKKLLARPALFSSPLGAAWEEPARQNVSAELQRLEKEQAKLQAEGDEAAADSPGAQAAPVVGADATGPVGDATVPSGDATVQAGEATTPDSAAS